MKFENPSFTPPVMSPEQQVEEHPQPPRQERPYRDRIKQLAMMGGAAATLLASCGPDKKPKSDEQALALEKQLLITETADGAQSLNDLANDPTVQTFVLADPEIANSYHQLQTLMDSIATMQRNGSDVPLETYQQVSAIQAQIEQQLASGDNSVPTTFRETITQVGDNLEEITKQERIEQAERGINTLIDFLRSPEFENLSKNEKDNGVLGEGMKRDLKEKGIAALQKNAHKIAQALATTNEIVNDPEYQLMRNISLDDDDSVLNTIIYHLYKSGTLGEIFDDMGPVNNGLFTTYLMESPQITGNVVEFFTKPKFTKEMANWANSKMEPKGNYPNNAFKGTMMTETLGTFIPPSVREVALQESPRDPRESFFSLIQDEGNLTPEQRATLEKTAREIQKILKPIIDNIRQTMPQKEVIQGLD